MFPFLFDAAFKIALGFVFRSILVVGDEDRVSQGTCMYVNAVWQVARSEGSFVEQASSQTAVGPFGAFDLIIGISFCGASEWDEGRERPVSVFHCVLLSCCSVIWCIAAAGFCIGKSY